MCGIAGIVRLDGSSVDRHQLDHITDALSHRGPDARGTWIHEHIGLGHRRLSIIDLTEGGAQPMKNDDGQIVLTFNGEIYNFEEKRRLLESRGYRFKSKSDTEVLLKLYEEFGTKCVDHLRGMFAFGIVDLRNQTLFLARDRIGKKPLKYFRSPTSFAFASELKALRTLPDCPREVDRESLHHFLTMMYVPSPGTGFTGIHKLPAAHTLVLNLKTGEENIERYWSLSYETDHQTSESEWEEKIMQAFEESVRLRMIADVPVGAFLSGGVDSGAVVAMMSRLSNKRVKTFSIGSDDPAFNELPQAALMAKHFGTDHHPIPLEADIVHLLPELVAMFEEPYADPATIPAYLVAKETRNDVTVALNGDGGDESFAGYPRYPIAIFSEKWARMPSVIHALTRQGTKLYSALRRNTLSYRANRFQQSIHLPFEQRYLQYLSYFTEEEKRALYAPGFAERYPRTDDFYARLVHEAAAIPGPVLHRAMNMDRVSYLADDLMPKVDFATMAHGLESRSPFLDHTFMELCATMPAEYKLHGKTCLPGRQARKWMLKKMMRGILPDEILDAKKRGFRLPLDKWFRTDLKDHVSTQLLEGSPLFWEMFDRNKMEKFLKAYHSSSIDYSDHLWALLWLKEWTIQYNQAR